MAKVVKAVIQANPRPHDFKINAISNRTILVQERGKVIFRKETSEQTKRKSSYANK